MGNPIIIHFYNNPFTILLHSFRTGFYNLFTQALLGSDFDPTPRGRGGLYLFVGGLYNTPPTIYNFLSKKQDKA